MLSGRRRRAHCDRPSPGHARRAAQRRKRNFWRRQGLRRSHDQEPELDGQKLDNKDFSGADAVDTSFKKASLRGARFFKSDCERADFSGADLTGASFESANLKDAILANAKAEGTAFSQTILDAKSFEGADFTEAVVQPYVQKERPASGRPAPRKYGVRDACSRRGRWLSGLRYAPRRRRGGADRHERARRGVW